MSALTYSLIACSTERKKNFRAEEAIYILHVSDHRVKWMVRKDDPRKIGIIRQNIPRVTSHKALCA